MRNNSAFSIPNSTPNYKGEVAVAREKLRKARKAAGMTQQAVADKLGIECRYYKSIESGERLGGIGMWDKLEDLFGVNQRVLREIHPAQVGSR